MQSRLGGSVKSILIVGIGAFILFFLTKRLSSDAIAMAIGIALGGLALTPTMLMLLFYDGNRAVSCDDCKHITSINPPTAPILYASMRQDAYLESHQQPRGMGQKNGARSLPKQRRNRQFKLLGNTEEWID